ncbi:Immunoglobulin-like and fibronectin type III domain-containing protein 1 [Chelonia mydas]|nr:Immunoglobulin-like and fibronectin type III domain-containing protein 1 [Chelonia mydas]
MKEPVIVKAGQNAMVKIPFEGRKPVRATWLRDGDELLNDARIHIDKADSFTRLSISSTNRKDCGDYKVKLKNESGTLEASLKLEVIDKPQKPIGPIEVVDSSTTGITIRWKPPKDDGGRPVQNYIIERQQVGRKTWVTLGESSRDNSTFTTNEVGQDKSYRFRVRAVNAEEKSKALESDEVMAATKVSPKFLRDDTMKNFMIIKAGSCIRVHTPFEIPPSNVTCLRTALHSHPNYKAFM